MSADKCLGDPMLDRMMKVIMVVARELYVTRDRLTVLEQILESRGMLRGDEIDSFRPEPSAETASNAQRDEFIARILSPLTKK